MDFVYLEFSGPYYPAFEMKVLRIWSIIYSVFRSDSGKQEPENLQTRTLFTQCIWLKSYHEFMNLSDKFTIIYEQ